MDSEINITVQNGYPVISFSDLQRIFPSIQSPDDGSSFVGGKLKKHGRDSLMIAFEGLSENERNNPNGKRGEFSISGESNTVKLQISGNFISGDGTMQAEIRNMSVNGRKSALTADNTKLLLQNWMQEIDRKVGFPPPIPGHR